MSGILLAAFARRFLLLCVAAVLAIAAARAQAGDAVYQQIDASVQQRVENVSSFSDTEKYDVYRGHDESHPAAEITVRMTYRRGVGRSYRILSQSGSDLIRKFGLIPLLNAESRLSQPGALEHTWFTTANYEMKLKPSEPELLNGRQCHVVTIVPRHKAPNALQGTLWVNVEDGSIVKVEGVASRRPSILAGTTSIMREYRKIHGYAMATHARAESNSHIIGRTVVTVEYSHYDLSFYPNPASLADSIATAGED
ncbi:MAG: hypothetical protein ACRD25_08710 [Terracidiphilus sp.]